MGLSLPISDLIEESLALERSGDISAALQRARQALELARSLSEPPTVAEALVCLAKMRFRLGQYRAAQALAEEALTWAAPDAPARADALLRLGACAAETDSLAEAEAFFQRAAELGREIGYVLAGFSALHDLAATVYIPRGQFDLALAADKEAYRIANEHAWREWIHFPLITMAWVSLVTGQRERTRALLDELGQVVLPGSSAQGYCIWLTADLALDEGDVETARALYAQARSIAEATGEPWLNIALRVGMSRYHHAVDDGPTARAWADDALAFATRVGYRHAQGNALIERARAVWLCGDLTAAEADLRTAIEILHGLGAAFDLARARFLLAALLHEPFDKAQGKQQRDEALSAWCDAVQAIIGGGYAFFLEQEHALAFPLIAAHLNHPDAALAKACAALLERLQRVPPSPLHIVTLGRFEVCQGSRRIEKRTLHQRRAGELLALLLLSPSRSLLFDQVAEALWPDRDPAAAQTAFHHATSALRRALEPHLPDKFPSRYLEVEEGRVTFHLPSGSWVDFEAFEAHCRQGEWEAALALYGGELLPEYPYADWTIAPRQQLSLLYQRALLAVAEARLAEGSFREALDACQRLLALESWHEQAVLIGMRACIRMNDRTGALRLYRNLEKALREDLGIAPQDELQALYRSLTR